MKKIGPRFPALCLALSLTFFAGTAEAGTSVSPSNENISMAGENVALFTDGFESGNTLAWAPP